jgi:hypothetical protein
MMYLYRLRKLQYSCLYCDISALLIAKGYETINAETNLIDLRNALNHTFLVTVWHGIIHFLNKINVFEDSKRILCNLSVVNYLYHLCVNISTFVLRF